MSVREAASKWFESFHFFDEDYSRYDNGDPKMDWQTLRHSLNQFIADSDDLRAALASDEDARDAARYRWLFPQDMDSATARVSRVYRQWDGQSDWHAAVDAAMKEPKP